MKDLKYLDLVSNKIQFLPSMNTLKKIEVINLQGNQIKKLPESIYDIKSLKEIYLGGNSLENPSQIKKKLEEKGIKVVLQ